MTDPSPSVADSRQSVIPLFPLGAVLFPGVVLPLHVFEPRYRLLVRRLMAPDACREFGVIAIRQGIETGADGVKSLYDVGCAAELRQVTPYDDGRFDIVGVGRRRFRLLDVDSSTEPYLRGTVEWLPESPTAVGDDAVVTRSVAELFLRCRRMLQVHQPEPDARPGRGAGGPGLPGDPEETALPENPLLLSHVVATAAPFTLDDRQSLLAAANTTERLRRELRLLKREVTMLSRLRAVPVPLAQLRVPMGLN